MYYRRARVTFNAEYVIREQVLRLVQDMLYEKRCYVYCRVRYTRTGATFSAEYVIRELVLRLLQSTLC